MAKADKIPKKIVGLKLPKSIRQAPEIRALLATPAGRKILGDALIEGASAAAANLIEARKALPVMKAASKPRKAKVVTVEATKGAAPASDLNGRAPQTVLLLDPDPTPEIETPRAETPERGPAD